MGIINKIDKIARKISRKIPRKPINIISIISMSMIMVIIGKKSRKPINIISISSLIMIMDIIKYKIIKFLIMVVNEIRTLFIHTPCAFLNNVLIGPLTLTLIQSQRTWSRLCLQQWTTNRKVTRFCYKNFVTRILSHFIVTRILSHLLSHFYCHIFIVTSLLSHFFYFYFYWH